MDESLEQFESETTAAIVTVGVVVAVLVPVLAVHAPSVLFVLAIGVVLAIAAPLLWLFARTGALDGLGGSSTASDDRQALERLRQRYADGDLTDEEFERRLDRLLETETLEDAKRYRTDAKRRTDRSRDAELER